MTFMGQRCVMHNGGCGSSRWLPGNGHWVLYSSEGHGEHGFICVTGSKGLSAVKALMLARATRWGGDAIMACETCYRMGGSEGR